MHAEGGLQADCYKNETHHSFADCEFTPFINLGNHSFTNLGKAEVSVNISKVKDT